MKRIGNGGEHGRPPPPAPPPPFSSSLFLDLPKDLIYYQVFDLPYSASELYIVRRAGVCMCD